jgi:hypothetical protein
VQQASGTNRRKVSGTWMVTGKQEEQVLLIWCLQSVKSGFKRYFIEKLKVVDLG